uniref:THAP domain-containing protein 11-like n=1 Tax=Rhipicephalus zambeziensis TaxID=60191 RepID=A0A224Z926_9ACAR
MSKNNCCVVGCSNTYKKSPGTHFYTFPVLFHERERRRRWIAAVRRRREDGSPWEPTKNSRICSQHFINGEKSNDPRSPAYVPTIFPSVYGRTKHGTSKRYQRLRARKQKVDSITDAQALEDVMVDCTAEEEKISVCTAHVTYLRMSCLFFKRQ